MKITLRYKDLNHFGKEYRSSLQAGEIAKFDYSHFFDITNIFYRADYIEYVEEGEIDGLITKVVLKDRTNDTTGTVRPSESNTDSKRLGYYRTLWPWKMGKAVERRILGVCSVASLTDD